MYTNNSKKRALPLLVGLNKKAARHDAFDVGVCKKKPTDKRNFQAFFSVPQALDLLIYVGQTLESFDYLLTMQDMSIWFDGENLSLCCNSFLAFIDFSKKLQRAMSNLVDISNPSEKKIFAQKFEDIKYKITMIKSHKIFPFALKPTLFLLSPSSKEDLKISSELSLKTIKDHLLKGLMKAKNHAGLTSLKIKIGTLCFYEFPCFGEVSAQELESVLKDEAPEAEFYTKYSPNGIVFTSRLSLLPSGEHRLAGLIMNKEAQPLELTKKQVFITAINRKSQHSLPYLIKLTLDVCNVITSKEISFIEVPISEVSLLLPSSPLDLQICLTSTLMVPDKALNSWVDSFDFRDEFFAYKNSEQFFVTSVVESNMHNLFYENQKVTFGFKKNWHFEYAPALKDYCMDVDVVINKAPDSCHFIVEMQNEGLSADFNSKQSKKLGRVAGWDPTSIVECTSIDELAGAAQRLINDLKPLLLSTEGAQIDASTSKNFHYAKI